MANAGPAAPVATGIALDLLDQSIEQGAANRCHWTVHQPRSTRGDSTRPLGQVPVVAMGGYEAPPEKGLPPWGPEQDWNVQCDTRAAEILIESASDLTLVTLAQTLKTHLRRAHLRRLRGSGRSVSSLPTKPRLTDGTRATIAWAVPTPGYQVIFETFITIHLRVRWRRAGRKQR